MSTIRSPIIAPNPKLALWRFFKHESIIIWIYKPGLRDRCILGSMWAAVLTTVLSRCAYRPPVLCFPFSFFLHFYFCTTMYEITLTLSSECGAQDLLPSSLAGAEACSFHFRNKVLKKRTPYSYLSWWQSNENVMLNSKQFCITFLSFKLNYREPFSFPTEQCCLRKGDSMS